MILSLADVFVAWTIVAILIIVWDVTALLIERGLHRRRKV
jgi:fatty-acid desaturase